MLEPVHEHHPPLAGIQRGRAAVGARGGPIQLPNLTRTHVDHLDRVTVENRTRGARSRILENPLTV